MLIVVTRPQSPPCGASGTRLTWVTKVPAPLRCPVFVWQVLSNGTWGWSQTWYYEMPANMTWHQIINSFPDMADVFRVRYKTDYYVFADPEQLASLQYFHPNVAV